MSANESSRHKVGGEWAAGLGQTFHCAGKVVTIVLGPLREVDGGLRFFTYWSEVPTRLTPEDFRTYEAGRLRAQALIRQSLQAESTQ